MVASSRTSTVVPCSHRADSTWQLVNFEELARMEDKQYATAASQLPSIRHRRGQTEGKRRLSMLRMRSRGRTTSASSTGHGLSPSESFDSLHHGDTERTNPESGWSDSDHSDSLTKSWVVKGSKMLRKQNSKFSLSSSRRNTWVEESDDTAEQRLEPRIRAHNKHSRIRSAGSASPVRPNISQPYDFRHLTHTQPHQFTDLHKASQHRLKTEFSAIRASQKPQWELQGIPTESLRSPGADSSRSACSHPITPPPLSPAESRPSRCNSGLSINLSRTRSIDNFSQPSPRAYRLPRSPGSPPARSSSRNAVHAAPDFFSEIHHATPQERDILAQYNPSSDIASFGPSLQGSGSLRQPDDVPDINNLPHAITTSDEIALTLRPLMTRRSTLALADVPEEDEFRSSQRVSNETFRPLTADPSLRHAMSFPSIDSSSRHTRVSSSHRSSRLSGVMPLERLRSQESENLSGDASSTESRVSRRISKDPNEVDASWQDDIDYCYQLEAEADCDFEWDRVSGENTLTKPSVKPPSRESGESLSKTYESSRKDQGASDTGLVHRVGSQHLPRLQTSLPELDFSAASSAKSSMASLCGPITPGQLPSPRKAKPAIQRSKSSDTLNLDLYFSASDDCDQSWPQEDLQKVPSWDHAMDFNYPFNNLSLSGCSARTSHRNNRPALSTHRSSDNMTQFTSSSTVQTRRNTNSSGSFPELVCSKNYRQQASVVAEQVADRIAALSVTDATAVLSNLHRSTMKNAALHSILKKDLHSCSDEASNPRNESAPASECVPQEESISVGCLASRLRSTSVASSVSGSSSMRSSRISYSLFPSPPTARL
ncbi:MAG: hypothetical protein Q9207_002560 [Kuettlingeria erythrocarpa]